MVEFTAENIEVVKSRFESLNVDMAEIKNRLETIYEQPFMGQFMDESERQMAAIRILFAQVLAQNEKSSFSKGELITMRIDGKDEVTAFKRRDGTESYRSNLYVTAIVNDEPKFHTATLWGDANEINSKLQVGKTYEIECSPGKVPGTLSINATDVLSVEIEIPDLASVIVNDYNPIDINEMDVNISKDWSDPKLVRATVMSTWMNVTKSDTNMGYMKVVGDDPENVAVAKFSNNADQVMMYAAGSMVYIFGQVTPAVMNPDGSELYSVGMWGNLVVPIVVIPPELPELESAATPIQKSDGGFTGDELEGW